MSETHGSFIDGSTCLSCWDDLSEENYVEYKESPESAWKPSGFCETCIEYLRTSQWKTYDNNVRTTKCKAEQRRLLKAGPPINLKDKTALPCEVEDSEVSVLWFSSDKSEHSAKLEGSLEGEERKVYWEEVMGFYIADEKGGDEEEEADKTQS